MRINFDRALIGLKTCDISRVVFREGSTTEEANKQGGANNRFNHWEKDFSFLIFLFFDHVQCLEVRIISPRKEYAMENFCSLKY